MANDDEIWLMSENSFSRFSRSLLPSEDFLRECIEAEPLILSDLLIIGNEVVTKGHGWIDLLAVDGSGQVWIIELKKGPATRKIMDQLIGYAAWARSLDRTALDELFRDYTGRSFGEAFHQRFGRLFPDGELSRVVTIVAASIDEHAQCQLFELEASGFPVRAYCYDYLFAESVEALRLRRCNFNPHTPGCVA